jgi:flagellar hook assembly protein FlgD
VAAAGLELAAPCPNPSAAATRLDFTLPSASSAELSVFDAVGRRVATLVQGDLPAGRHSASWDGHAAGGGQVAAGLYFARLATQQGTVSRRIVRSN